MFNMVMRGFFLAVSLVLWSSVSGAAPYAALVMDARTGEVLHSRNADTPLHPASLTKMMTLYVVFHEVEAGRMSLDQMVTISRNATREPPSKLGLRSGQKIALRYLIRAAAVKSANDAATALGEAVSGSEAEFARYMTSTARAMGMSNTTFKNAHGLTTSGHLSTARDMATLGRRLFYDFPDYYNLFSRVTTETSVKTVYNTNRKFLAAYRGADGIKTGYTNAAGFNLVASAQRGEERIIASMFGGTSTAQRNRQVAKLLDMGFQRAPTHVATIRPRALNLSRPGEAIIRATGLVQRTERPMSRGGTVASPSAVLMARNIDNLVTELVKETAETELQQALATLNESEELPDVPMRRPINFRTMAKVISIVPLPAASLTPVQEFGDWSVELGNYSNRTNTEKLLLMTALMDLDALQGAERKVEVTMVSGVTMYRARFVGLSESDARKACSRLIARNSACEVINPS